jgi:hypothetical protein
MKSTLKTAQAFSGAIQFLMEKLRAVGATLHAEEIRRALDGPHTTSSETYGELAIALKAIRKHHGGELRRLIDDCRAFAVHHRRILGLK